MEKFSPSQAETNQASSGALDFRRTEVTDPESQSVPATENVATEERGPTDVDHNALKYLADQGFDVPDSVKYELGLNGGQNGNQSNN